MIPLKFWFVFTLITVYMSSSIVDTADQPQERPSKKLKISDSSTPNSSNTGEGSTSIINSIYDISVTDIEGNTFLMRKYENLVLLIINVTINGDVYNYFKKLKKLYNKYRTRGLKILAFPCSTLENSGDFINADVLEYAIKNKIDFDLFSKIEINGDEASDLWKYLKLVRKGYWTSNGEILQNFTIFIVNREGEVKHRFSPTALTRGFKSALDGLLPNN